MTIDIGIGQQMQSLVVPEGVDCLVLKANPVAHTLSEEEAVARALENPVGAPRLREIIKPGEKIAVVTSDISRPMPTARVMPLLLDELYAGGAKKEDITLVFALGSHRKQTPEEQKKLAGDRAWAEIACVDSDPEDVIHLGTTARGTPVDIFRTVAEADRVICLGNIEYHYFAGYSGGVKAIMPGCATREAIQANHKRMVDAAACAGHLAGNPVREDLEEAGAIVGIDFILNVVLDEHKKIVYAAAGDVTAAHRDGCRYLDTMYAVRIPEKADIVVVSQGGAPKDLNLYQTQKALDNAKHAVKDGGVIILVGSCKEGLGESHFEEWIRAARSPRDLVERLGREFVLGGHKAAAIAMVEERAKVYLVSEQTEDFARSVFMTPFQTVQSAFDAALAEKGAGAKVIVMPYGGSTLPRIGS
ncbi:MAG: nickel-dependent lactate racemase [Clostridia bacterium]|nr:nickel-dependent lactate racemase [Clostridia bacterium]